MGPCEPAAGGTLVDVHVLQVDIHPNNAPAGEGTKGGWEVQGGSRLEFEDDGDKDHKRQQFSKEKTRNRDKWSMKYKDE